MAGLRGKKCGIINPLFDGLTYNTRRYFAHCTNFSSSLPGSYHMLNHRIRCMYHRKTTKQRKIKLPGLSVARSLAQEMLIPDVTFVSV